MTRRRYAWRPESPQLVPPGPLYRRKADAVQVARYLDGCGRWAGMRARRVVVTPAQWEAAKP